MNLSHAYASILKASSSAKSVNEVLEYMVARGHKSLMPQIVRILEREKNKGEATVTLAKSGDEKKFAKEIESALKEIGESEHSIAVDPHIVGGYMVRGRSKAIDRTYRRALVSIYQRTIG